MGVYEGRGLFQYRWNAELVVFALRRVAQYLTRGQPGSCFVRAQRGARGGDAGCRWDTGRIDITQARGVIQNIGELFAVALYLLLAQVQTRQFGTVFDFF